MIRTEIKAKGFAAFISLTTGKSGKITPTHIVFEFENEIEIEELERSYAASDYQRFNQLVVTLGNQQRKLQSKIKGAN